MMLTILGVVVAVAALAWVLRLIGGGTDEAVQLPDGVLDGIDTDVLDDTEDDLSGPGPDTDIAVTSDGWAFIPARTAVHLVPPGDCDGVAAPGLGTERDAVTHAQRADGLVNPRTGGRMSRCGPKETLGAGDLAGARVVRGAPDFDPWRLEGLGRDGELRAWRFETEDAARTALGIVTECVVRAPRGKDGEPQPPGDADYLEAIRRDATTQAELAASDDLLGEGDARA